MLFWKCKYGYATLDEAFYPTIAHRFLQGDRILYDEWSNTQLSALLIMPFLKVYKSITGDYTGVYLYLRYSYTAIKVILCIGVYFGLKRFGEQKAFFATLLFLIFSYCGLMVISYNTIAIGGFLCWILFMLNADDSNIGFAKLIIGGCFLSISVLGIPYIAIIYIVYILAVIITFFFKIRNKAIKSFYSFRSLFGVTVGVLISATLFLLYVFSQTSIKQIVITIPQILLGDAAHQVKSLYQLTLGYFSRIFLGNTRNIIVFSIYFILTVIVFRYLILQKNKKRVLDRIEKYYILLIGAAGVLLTVAYSIGDTPDNYINNIIFIPNIVACCLFFMNYKNKRVQEAFFCIVLPGMTMTYAEYLASNTGFSGISAFSCVATLGSIIIIGEIIQLKEKEMISKSFLIAFCAFLFCSVLYCRCTKVFWEDGGLESLTHKISDGVASGLIVTNIENNQYNQLLFDTEEISFLDVNKNVLFIGDKVLWMQYGQRCGSYSPLCYSIITTRDILYNYYYEHPEKIPENIYIQYSLGDYKVVEEITKKLGYKYVEKEIGWMLYKQ